MMTYASIFCWSPETWTAVGTLTLAFFTAVLAYSTRKLAFESRDEVRANWRPVLVSEPTIDANGGTPAVSMRAGTLFLVVHNVGRGPALGVRWRLDNEDEVSYRPEGSYDDRIVAPNGFLTLKWEEFQPQSPDRWSVINISVGYSDVSRARYESKFTVAVRDDGLTDMVTQFVEPNPRFIKYLEPTRAQEPRLTRLWRRVRHRLRSGR